MMRLILWFILFPLSLWANPIADIAVKVDQPLDRNENVELNQYLSDLKQQEANQASLETAQKRLLAPKIYKDVSCAYENNPKGVSLLCQIKRIPIVRRIVIQHLPVILLEKDLRKRLAIQPGELFDIESATSEAQMGQIQKTVATFLERQGFYDAKITVDSKPIKNAAALDVIIDIEGGSFRHVNQVTLSPEITFDQNKIIGMFKNMCRRFRYIFEAIGTGGFNCYSREKERDVIQDLQNFLDQKGYYTASISTQKTVLDALNPKVPKKCKWTKQDLRNFEKNGGKPSPRCVDIHVSMELGPQVITEFIFENAQHLTLSPSELFFRNFFGVEFFSRLFNNSFVGAKWPADETIITNDLKKALSFSNSRKIDEGELTQSIKNIQSVLADRGYPLSNVRAEQDNIQNKIIYLRFFIEVKNPLAIKKIHFSGQPIFSEEKILKEVNLAVVPRSPLHSGHFDDSLLSADTEKLKGFYLTQGYRNVQIQLEKRLTPEGIHIWYQINPGPQYTIQELHIENGIPALLPEILPTLSNCLNAKGQRISDLNETSVCTGSPFLSQSVTDDESRILDIYRANGYLQAKIKTKIIQNDTKNTLIFYLNSPEENRQARIAGILIDGNSVTRSSVMMRLLGQNQFLPNTPLRLPKLEEGMAKLRQTNLYSKVNYRYLRKENTQDKDDVFIFTSVVEKPSLTLDMSLGFSTDNLFSLGAQVDESNLFGNMLQLTTQVDLGLFWGRKSNIKNTFRWPSIYGLPLDFELIIPQMIYTIRPTRDPPERHFLTQIIASLEWQLSPTVYPYLKYELRWDKWQQQYNPNQFVQDFGNMLRTFDGLSYVLSEPSTIRSILTPGVNYIDVDHPFNPKNGLKLNFSTDLSFSLLGAQIPFQILNAQMAHYFTVGPFTFATQLVLRRAFIENPDSMWWALKYQSDMDSLGGDRSVRGYQPGTIGIWGPMLDNRNGTPLLDSSGNPVLGYHPGNLSIQGNLEVRFPLKKDILIGDLDGAIFTDFAFIDTCKSIFNCQNPSASWTQLNSQIGWSVGVGLRYVLPIGPISLDYAVSPIRQANNWIGRESRIHFLFGYSF